MSFSSDTKNELCKLPLRTCCRRAECYGLFLLGKSFSPSSVVLSTENPMVARTAADTAARVTGAVMKIAGSGAGGGGACTVSAAGRGEAEKIFGSLGHTGREISLHINLANLENECCRSAFLRGAFLSCGTVADPSCEYHLEFAVPYMNLAKDLTALMRDILELDLQPRFSRRKSTYVVYVKGGERVADFLTFLGAPSASMKLTQIRMFKELRNQVNRQTNFETANIGKTASAAAQEVLAIEKIQRTCGLAALPEDLQKLAAVRLQNPELSLRELGLRLVPPLSRSGVYHRLERIIRYSETCRK